MDRFGVIPSLFVSWIKQSRCLFWCHVIEMCKCMHDLSGGDKGIADETAA